MKRYISLVLVAVVLVMSLAVPSYAADFENPYGINLMDYYVFDTFYTTFDNTPITFDLPLTSLYYAVDLVVSSSYAFENVYFKRGGQLIPLNISHIYGDLYRIYGSFEKLDSNQMTLVFDTVAAAYFTVQSFHLYYSPIQFFDAAIEAIGGAGPDNDFALSLNYGDSRPTYTQYSVTWEYATFNLSISAPYWDRYDFLDVVLYMNVSSINSISASFGGVDIPLDVSYLPSSDGLDPTYILSLRLDFRGLDRTGEDPPLLRITGVSNTDGLNYISLWNAKGGVILDTVKPLPYFFTNLFSGLSTWFGNVGTWISNQTTALTNTITTGFTNVGTWISSQTSSLINEFNNLETVLNDLFVDADGFSIARRVRAISMSLHGWFIEQTTSINSTISTWGQKIFDAIVGDTGPNQEIEDARDTQEEVNQQLNVQLDSAVQEWNDNFGTVSSGFNTAFQNSTPALIWLSDKAQAVYSNMGWFGSIFFFLGFLEVFFLLMSKSGLGKQNAKGGDDS